MRFTFLLIALCLLPGLSFSQDDLLDLGGDLLSDDGLLEESSVVAEEEEPVGVEEAASAAHLAVYSQTDFPSAKDCATCHPDHYREWSVSPHAYALLSPVFNTMHAKIVKQTNGTNGDFCIRCHTPVGMQLGEPEHAPVASRDPVSREGVTCITCHRLEHSFGKVSGRLPVKRGDIFDPVYGPTGDSELKRVLSEAGKLQLAAKKGTRGRKIHGGIVKFAEINSAGFCGACHDVTFVNGFRLEEAFSEFKGSPAAKRGESCVDCHMGDVPGVSAGFREAPAAKIGNFETRKRKRTNHMFTGPDYSIVHPGIFPHNPDAAELATIDEWTQFDWRAGWGTDRFERVVSERYPFPERWESPDDRFEAREIIDKQLELLAVQEDQRLALLRNGYKLGDIVIDRAKNSGLWFRVEVSNGTDGHNVPTGFIAERLVFLQVSVVDRKGKVIFESGDLDPNGDVRDSHSVYVRNGILPIDEYLFSLQSKFITRNFRGGEREQVLATNLSIDPLLFVRPETSSSVLVGRTRNARIHRQGIAPNDSRWAKYAVNRDEIMKGKGPFKISVKLIAGMVPVNLIHEIHDAGFDYNLSPREVADRVVAGHQILWERTKTVGVR